MGCPRCHNIMMVRETFVNIESETYPGTFLGWRCVVCGVILDPAILFHRAEQPQTVGDRIRRRGLGVVAASRTG